MFLLGDILHNAQGNKLVIARTSPARVVQAAGAVPQAVKQMSMWRRFPI
jgi:hypothetical protein